MLVTLSGAPRWPLHTFLLKMSNTRSPRTLERNAYKIWPRGVVLDSLQFYKHFDIEICILVLLNFDDVSAN